MADELTPEMLDTVRELSELVPDLQNSLGSLNGVVQNLGSAVVDFSDKTRNLGSNIDEVSKKAGDAKAHWGGLTDIISQFSGKVKDLPQFISENSNAIVQMGTALFAMSEQAQKALPVSDIFKTLGSVSQDSLGTAAKSFDKAAAGASLFGSTAESVVKKFSGFGRQFDAARNAENAFLKISAQAGNLDETLLKFGKDLSGLDRLMDNFSTRMVEIGNKTGHSSEEVTKFALTAGQVPGLMNEMTNIVDSTGQQMDFFTAALKVNRGSIKDLDTVLDTAKKQMLLFGNSGEHALGIIARMHSAVQTLDIPLIKMKDFVNQNAEAFKFFGDQSQSALNIMNKLAPALRESGLGPEAITELVGGLTKGISQLSIAQKSFISGQAGGPGGLQGAFQIEKLLREGDMDKVFEQMQGALKKQFGGQIVGLDEAAQDQGAAAQLTKQIALLRQGPFGQMVKSDQEAIRLLEAIKSGVGPGALKTTEDAVSNAVQEGEAIQKRQTTVLNKISNTLDLLSQKATQQVFLLARTAGGTGARTDVDLIDNLGKKAESLLTEINRNATNQINRVVEAEQRRDVMEDVGPRGEVGVGRLPTEALIGTITDVIDEAKRAGQVISPEPINTTEQTSPEPFVLAPTEIPQGDARRLVTEREPITRDVETVAPLSAVSPVTEHHVVIDMKDMEGGMRNIAKLEIKNNNTARLSRQQGTPVR